MCLENVVLLETVVHKHVLAENVVPIFICILGYCKSREI